MVGRARCAKTGDRAELLAAAWLLAKGYEVFRNVSSVGPADLIAWDPVSRQTILVDVKGISNKDKMFVRKDGTLALALGRADRHPDVRLLHVVGNEVLGFFPPLGDETLDAKPVLKVVS